MTTPSLPPSTPPRAEDDVPLGLTARIVDAFLTSKLSPLFVLFSLLAGVATLAGMPREEEPQIVVPMADVLVALPGASAREVEDLVTSRLEAMLWEIDGVEHVYSRAEPGRGLVTVRFHVGEDREDSLVELHDKIAMNQDRVPAGVAGWVVKPIEIDDLPILTLTLHGGPGARYDDRDLRRIAEETARRLAEVPDTAHVGVIGGRRRVVGVALDLERMAARGVTTADLERAVAGGGASTRAGTLVAAGRETVVDVGPFLTSADDVASLVVRVADGRLVHLGDVADVVDGPDEPTSAVRVGFGPAAGAEAAADGEPRSAVTITVAKRTGTNAVRVADAVLERFAELRGRTVPDDVAWAVTRNAGETADEKVNELVEHLGIAVATILVLLAFTLGTRAAAIVALAVPMTLALTLLGGWLVGFTINRVTLFALILSLGLLVDDPIVDVENIHRHLALGRLGPRAATLFAVDEVRPPTILATFAVIFSFLPMFFVTGMMGPYMAPMPYHVPLAMLLSLVMAFTVTPWASYRWLPAAVARERAAGGNAGHEHGADGWLVARYRRTLAWLLGTSRRGALFLAAVVAALVGSIALAVLGLVPMKMLPYANRDELEIVVDAPEGSALEETDRVVREVEELLARVPEVRLFESYVGLAAPTDFNGMVRHSFLREGGAVAQVRVHLAEKDERVAQSHEIALRIRPEIEAIARRTGAKLGIVELPPGPPVLATVVAEVYGEPDTPYATLVDEARRLEDVFASIPGLVDVDSTGETPRRRLAVEVDREKAALHGVATRDVAHTLGTLLGGRVAGTVHVPGEREVVPVELRLPRASRVALADLTAARVAAQGGGLVPLGELVRSVDTTDEVPIVHKDLTRFAYVTAEVAGISPLEAVLAIEDRLAAAPPPEDVRIDLAGEGEWKITLDVFRDLGIAFGVALAAIYVLLAAQTSSFGLPLVIMAAIPLTLIGILPGFWLLNVVAGTTVAGYASPIFFTATGMIGMIALAGIVVRNSIILIDFIEVKRAEGVALGAAVVEASAVRLRPILLTAAAAVFGAWVITLDPIFSGLAWSFIFGIFASTVFTLGVIPVLYAFVKGGAAPTAESAREEVS